MLSVLFLTGLPGSSVAQHETRPAGGCRVALAAHRDPTDPTTIFRHAIPVHSDAGAQPLRSRFRMNPCDRSLKGEKLMSANGKYQLRGASDGNFVIVEEIQQQQLPIPASLYLPYKKRKRVEHPRTLNPFPLSESR